MTISRKKVNSLIGLWVKVNIGGPESKEGHLLGVTDEYLALLHKDVVIYYQLSHVKSVSITTTKLGKLSRCAHFIDDCTFVELLKELKHHKVKINRGGPESIEGVLSEVHKDHIELTVCDKILFVTIHHIKSISKVDKKSSGKKSSGKKSSGKKSSGKKSDGKKSSGKKSSGKKSSGKKSSGKSSGKKSSGKSSGKKSSGKKSSGKCERVSDAFKKAHKHGNDKYMWNDPYGSSGKSSSSGKRSHDRKSKHSRKSCLTSLEKQGWIKL
ncbi:hypothetical protein ACTWQL_12795 [Pseudalkalibacillus sp. R45]|uniref:hypothetical protein n=1 Tax=Pseudalkalibacillus sp. R45 TaxID=3457433 RepID=UPI003FCCA525